LAAITVGIAAIPLVVLASLTPANASSTNVVIVISKSDDAARQLESAFAFHHFKITVTAKSVPPGLVGSILSVSTTGTSGTNARVISEVRGQCVGGAPGCIDGLVLPLHFSGTARVVIGRPATWDTFAVAKSAMNERHASQ
jgi:hypothetical protein